MADLIAAMRDALRQFSTGTVQQPLRAVLEIGEAKSFFGVMPAALTEPAAVGTKLVTVVQANRHLGLPSHLATIVLLDPVTGRLMALLDGRYITEARTAAVSAVSVGLLANPAAHVLAILGSGVQARSHLEALGHVRSFDSIRVWSPTPERRDAFVADARAHPGASVIASPSARAAVRDADVIVVATSSPVAVLLDKWVADGTHICAVGACRPTQREMEGALVARARTYVDSRSGAFSEAGDIVMALTEGAISRDHVVGELGELIAGTVSGRQNLSEVTLFKSLGMAVEDIAAAHLAFSRAVVRGLGSEIDL